MTLWNPEYGGNMVRFEDQEASQRQRWMLGLSLWDCILALAEPLSESFDDVVARIVCISKDSLTLMLKPWLLLGDFGGWDRISCSLQRVVEVVVQVAFVLELELVRHSCSGT
jgi:hypothetical protein